jgi:hypothetical protein
VRRCLNASHWKLHVSYLKPKNHEKSIKYHHGQYSYVPCCFNFFLYMLCDMY